MIPTVSATALFDKIDEFMLEFSEHDKEVNVGIVSEGDAAAYSETWEWGNVRQSKQGPKTVLGTSPDGKQVWLSIQAPTGYIRINENNFWEAIKDEMSKASFNGTNPREMTEELQEIGNKAMKRCIEFLRQSVPVDKGTLGNSFRVAEDGDPILENTEDTRTLFLEQGE